MPLTHEFLSANLGTGRRAARRKEWDESLSHITILMFARLINSGWATQSPVRTEILVLSEESIVPNRVALAGICDYFISVQRPSE